MKNRISAGLLIAIVAALGAAPSYAQVYKWVDSNGKVNYSGQPPAESDAAKSVKVVESNISVYTPDDSLKQAVEENRKRKNHQAAPEKLNAVAARPSCADMGMVPTPQGGCQPVTDSSEYYPYSSYGPAVVYNRFRRRPVHFSHAQIPPGTTAGNVVGMNGYIAGNSAYAPAPQPARPFTPGHGWTPK